jgi:hypothetical protein
VTALAERIEEGWVELVVQENGLPAMLWVITNPWHFSARRPMVCMTGQFEVSKIEIIARLAEHLIPLAQQAASAGIPICDFERGLFGGLLAVGGKVMDAFLEAQKYGDQGNIVTHEDQTLYRSEEARLPTAENNLRSSSVPAICLSRKNNGDTANDKEYQ